MPRSASQTTALLPLTPAVLHILLALADGAAHGYAIAQEVEALTDGLVRMGPGTLYGSLQRMVADGLIDDAPVNRRHESEEPRRRYYRATSLGRSALERELQRLERVVSLARRKHLLRAPGAA